MACVSDNRLLTLLSGGGGGKSSTSMLAALLLQRLFSQQQRRGSATPTHIPTAERQTSYSCRAGRGSPHIISK